MKNYRRELSRIKEILAQHPRGLTVSEISHKLCINRNSVAKYLDVLTISGNIDIKYAGPAKIFFRSHRVPLNAVLNFSSDYILVLDKYLKITQINDALLKYMGTDKERVIGQSIMYSPHQIFDHQAILPKIEAALEGKSTNDEITFKKGEQTVYFKIKIVPTTFENGDKGVTIILEDITEKKEAEKALQQSEERTRKIIDSSPDGITITDLMGKILDCNPATLQMHGYPSKEELLGKSAFDLIAPKDHIRAKKNLQNTLSRGVIKNLEYTLLRKDRSEFMGELSASVIMDNTNSPFSFVAITKDITERKKTEQELRRTYCAIENCSAAVFTTDMQGKVMCTNPAAAILWGFRDTSEMVGTHVLDYWTENTRKKAREIMEILIKEGHYSGSDELKAKRRDNSEFLVKFTASLMKDKDGKNIGMTGAFNYVGEIKKQK